MKKSIIPVIFLMLCVSILIPSCNNTAKKEATTEKVDASDPEKVPVLLGKTASLGSKEEQALTKKTYNSLVKAIEKDPNDFESLLKLSQLYMQEARITGEHGYYYPAALKTVDEVLSRNSQRKDVTFMALTLKASVLLSLHQFDKALETGKRALALNDHNAQLYGVLADANVELGNYGEAVKMADKMVAIRPDLRSYSRISYLREIHGDVDGAKEAMKMAVDAGYPGYEETAWSRLTLGNLYETYGDLKHAEMHYLITLEERPDYPFAIAALAGIEMKRDNYDSAEVLLQKAAGIIPEVSFYEKLAKIYQETGREYAKEEMLKAIFEMMEEDEESGHNMDIEYANIHLQLTRDYNEAMKYALKEYKMRPDNINVNKILAAIYLKKGNQDKAGYHVKKAMATNSQDPELLHLAGLINPI